MNLLNNKLMDLIDPKFFISKNDKKNNNKKRKLECDDFDDIDHLINNHQPQSPRKKQRLINDMDITSKTTHIQPPTQQTKSSPNKKLTFGATDINENEYIYVSNEEKFKKLLIREKEKYNILLKKLNHFKKNNNDDDIDEDNEEIKSLSESVSDLSKLINTSELIPLEIEECFLCSWGNSA